MSQHSAQALDDCLTQIQDAGDELSVVTAVDAAKKALGVDSAVFVSFIRDDVSSESYRFLMACDAMYCGQYRRSKWFVNDPAISYAALNSAPVLLSDLSPPSEAEEIISIAALRGFKTGAVFPAPSPGLISRVGVLIVGSNTDACNMDWFKANRSMGRVLSMELLEWSVKQIRQDLVRDARLSDEDIELLRYERAGLSSKEIAPRVNASSAAAVDGKFQRLLPRIGASTRRNAARIAAEAGIIA